jgi:cell division protein FtsZ
MSSGIGNGEERLSLAINNALNSPLLNNNDVFKAKKILLNVSFSENFPLMMEEMNDVNDFMAKFGKDIEVIWGLAVDETLEENVKVTILATGFGIEDIPMMSEKIDVEKKMNDEEKRRIKIESEQDEIKKSWLIKKYYGEDGLRNIGRTTRPKPFLFTLDQLDDDEIIDAVINHPAYNRNPKVMLHVEEKTEAARLIFPEEEEEKAGEKTREEDTENTILF